MLLKKDQVKEQNMFSFFFCKTRVKSGSIKVTYLTSGWKVQLTDRHSSGYSNGLKNSSLYPCRMTKKCDLVSHGR